MTLIPELISHPTISNRLLFPFSCSFIWMLRKWNQFCWIFWFLAQRARMCARCVPFILSLIAFAIRQSRTLVFNGLRLLICIQSECRLLILNGRHCHNIPEISYSVPSFHPNYTLISPQRCLLSLSNSAGILYVDLIYILFIGFQFVKKWNRHCFSAGAVFLQRWLQASRTR